MSTSDNSESEEEYKVCPSSYGNHYILGKRGSLWDKDSSLV